MRKLIKTIIYSLGFALPVLVGAQGLFTGDAQGATDWFFKALNNIVMPIIITLMVVMLLVGIFKKFFQKSEKASTEGTQFIIWSLVGLTVALTIFGFVGFFKRTLFGNNPVDPQSSGGITPCVYDTNGPFVPGC